MAQHDPLFGCQPPTNALCIGNVARKKLFFSSVSNKGMGDPFLRSELYIFGKPVLRPSVKSSSFRKSPLVSCCYVTLIPRMARILSRFARFKVTLKEQKSRNYSSSFSGNDCTSSAGSR